MVVANRSSAVGRPSGRIRRHRSCSPCAAAPTGSADWAAPAASVGGGAEPVERRRAAAVSTGASRPGSVPQLVLVAAVVEGEQPGDQVGEQPDRGPAGRPGRRGRPGPAALARRSRSRPAAVEVSPRPAAQARLRAASSAASGCASTGTAGGRGPVRRTRANGPPSGRPSPIMVGVHRQGNGTFGQRRLHLQRRVAQPLGERGRPVELDPGGPLPAGQEIDQLAGRADQPYGVAAGARRDLAVARAPARAARPGTGAAAAGPAWRPASRAPPGRASAGRAAASRPARGARPRGGRRTPPCWPARRSAGC